MSCYVGPKQGQAEQLSKSRKKFLATKYKPLFTSLDEIIVRKLAFQFITCLDPSERSKLVRGDCHSVVSTKIKEF